MADEEHPMKVIDASDFYKDNWKNTNKWLQEKAPDYVIQCIEEFRQAADKAVKIIQAFGPKVTTRDGKIVLPGEPVYFEHKPLIVHVVGLDGSGNAYPLKRCAVNPNES